MSKKLVFYLFALHLRFQHSDLHRTIYFAYILINVLLSNTSAEIVFLKFLNHMNYIFKNNFFTGQKQNLVN